MNSVFIMSGYIYSAVHFFILVLHALHFLFIFFLLYNAIPATCKQGLPSPVSYYLSPTFPYISFSLLLPGPNAKTFVIIIFIVIPPLLFLYFLTCIPHSFIICQSFSCHFFSFSFLHRQVSQSTPSCSSPSSPPPNPYSCSSFSR